MEVQKFNDEELKKTIEDKEKKLEKVNKMRNNISTVMAERKESQQQEYNHRMNVNPMTVFPFTHGDTVEAARQQIKEEM